MITAFESGGITILIHHSETPIKDKGKFVPVDGTDNLIKLKTFIQKIEFVIPDHKGKALIFPISIHDIKKLHDITEAILKEIPAPGNASDYDY